jgi:hypothetical protein
MGRSGTDSTTTEATTGQMYQPRIMMDDDEGRVNRSTRRKPAQVPLCPSQIPHDLTRARTRAASVGSRRQTA